MITFRNSKMCFLNFLCSFTSSSQIKMKQSSSEPAIFKLVKKSFNYLIFGNKSKNPFKISIKNFLVGIFFSSFTSDGNNFHFLQPAKILFMFFLPRKKHEKNFYDFVTFSKNYFNNSCI